MEIADKAIADIDKDIVSTAKRIKISNKVLNHDIDLFLIARHAPERNAQHGEKAAGISNEEAVAIIQEIENKPYVTEIKRIAERIQVLNN